MKLLIIEDERAIALPVLRVLTQEGYDVTWQPDGAQGLAAALTGQYDLVILDLLLPRINGWEVCRRLRCEDVNIPVLMLSALDEASDKVRGLNLGADDFLAKPFDTEELLARIRALLRKDMIHRGQTIRVADLLIDCDARTAERAGTELELTQSEFDILVKLAAYEGLPIQPKVLAHNVPLASTPLSDPFESCMASLRAKIDGPFGTPLIRVSDGAYLMCVAPN